LFIAAAPIAFAAGWLLYGRSERHKCQRIPLQQFQNLVAAPLIWEETKPGMFIATCRAIYWSFEVYTYVTRFGRYAHLLAPLGQFPTIRPAGEYGDWHMYAWCGSAGMGSSTHHVSADAAKQAAQELLNQVLADLISGTQPNIYRGTVERGR
jgi:hypothetical protein